MMIDISWDSLYCAEGLMFYEIGGIHPVHLGDRVDKGKRYKVIHKLGHGLSSTLWLGRDTHLGRYVALKIFSADREFPKIFIMITNWRFLSTLLIEDLRQWTYGIEIYCFWTSSAFLGGRTKWEAPCLTHASLWT